MKKTLAEIANLIPGFAFKSNEFGDYDTKAIKIGDIGHGIAEDNLPGISINAYDAEKLEKFLCKPGDYLIAMTGNTIGKTGCFTHGKAYVNQRVLRVTPNKNFITAGYLGCIVKSKELLNFILSNIDSHSAQPNISARTIGKFTIDLPPIEEQKKRSQLITLVDNKIELNNRINGYLAE